MKRYRRDEISRRQEFGAGSCHPAAAGPRDIGAVTVLEGQDQASTAIVVDQRGAGAIEVRPSSHAAGAESLRAQVFLERRAATGAMWRRHEVEILPTGGTQPSRLANDLVASEAERRQDGVQHRPPRPRAGLAEPKRQACKHRSDWAVQIRRQDGIPYPPSLFRLTYPL